MARGFGGGRPGFATEQEITPEDLFNMFFGGGELRRLVVELELMIV